MRIWDLHTHFATSGGTTAEQRAGTLLRAADRMGIERLCLYMGFPWSQDPSPEKFRAENDQAKSNKAAIGAEHGLLGDPIAFSAPAARAVHCGKVRLEERANKRTGALSGPGPGSLGLRPVDYS